MKQSLLAYLKSVLQFQLKDWQALDAATKEWYKNAARQEMNVLGIEINEEASASTK